MEPITTLLTVQPSLVLVADNAAWNTLSISFVKRWTRNVNSCNGLPPLHYISIGFDDCSHCSCRCCELVEGFRLRAISRIYLDLFLLLYVLFETLIP